MFALPQTQFLQMDKGKSTNLSLREDWELKVSFFFDHKIELFILICLGELAWLLPLIIILVILVLLVVTIVFCEFRKRHNEQKLIVDEE